MSKQLLIAPRPPSPVPRQQFRSASFGFRLPAGNDIRFFAGGRRGTGDGRRAVAAIAGAQLLELSPLMIGALITTAVLGSAAGLGYSSMAPKSQLFGQTFTGSKVSSRQIALTFDDGPSASHTLDLLEVLDKNRVKATFFMIGRYVLQLPKVAEAVARAGHVIGNHTYTHPNLIFCSPTQVRLQLEECERALAEVVGDHSRLFRPPFGGRRPAVLQVARELNLKPVMWNITGYDWNSNPAGRIAARVVRRAQGGDVILLHDGGHRDPDANRAQTVIATDRLIQRCREAGLEFVSVPEMMDSFQPSAISRQPAAGQSR
jgi:peptidoglycan/xylan/chitin deacetylase (PgdA/CDA1 family)